MNISISTGTMVSFWHGTQIIEGKVEAIARVTCGLRSIKVNGQWYSDISDPWVKVNCDEIPKLGNGDMVRYVSKFFKIPVTLPDFWLKMTGNLGQEYHCRYVDLQYSGSNYAWNNSCYSSVYRHLVDHPAIAYHLIGANLANDSDSLATQALIIDCGNPQSIELYVGNFGDVMRFLVAAAPHVEPLVLNEEEWDEVKDTGNYTFELFLGGSNEQSRMMTELTRHLNAYITKDLIEGCVEAAKYSDQASFIVRQLQLRLAAMGRIRG